MAFLDEDDALAPDPAARPRPSRAERQRQFLARRLVAVVIGILVLVLLALGIKGCLNARKERNFENYASDLTSIEQQSKQLSDRFFGRFRNPGDDTISFQSDIAADRGTAESQLNLVRGLDTPGELDDEQGELDLAFELRAQAIAGISDQISTALGKQGSKQAEEQIADYMRWFLASDVLNTRAVDGINATLSDEGIDRHVPAENFLPDDIETWLDPTNLSQALAGVAGAAGAVDCKGQLRGTELVGTTINGVALVPGGTVTVSGGAPYELDAQVLNGGEADESDITVDYKMAGAGGGQATIGKLASGATGDATTNLKPVPQAGSTVNLTVTVRAVPCEELTDNNTAEYSVLFQ